MIARFSALVACGAAISLSAPAAAQSSDADATGIDAIIVEARRWSEPIETVPESVTVFSADEIENAGVATLRDIADVTPSFSIVSNYRPGLERFQVRGLITPQVGDPPLVFLFDGVTAPAPEFATVELFDLERVEVLRGAQGALYGRGTVGGAVNITSRQPTDEFEGRATASFANGETSELSAVISGPFVEERVQFRLGGYRHRSDGLIQNEFLGQGADLLRRDGLLAQLRTVITPDTAIDLRADIGQSRDGHGYYNPAVPTRASIEDFSAPVSQNVLGVNDREHQRYAAKVEHAFDGATLTLAGGYAETSDDGFADGDITAEPSDGVSFFPSWQRAEQDIEAWTFESRLVSDVDGRFAWGLGAFYQARDRATIFSVFDDPAGTERLTRADLDTAALLFAIADEQTSRAWALSGQASYDVTERLELTVAGRYDRDARESLDPRDPVTTFGDVTFDAFQPKVSVAYQLTPELLVYSGYSRGFRSGGFNEFSPLVARSFGEELTDSYEVGAKARMLDNRVTLAGALFRNEQSDAQITRFNPDSFTLENIGIDDVLSQGAELELAARLTPELTIRANAGYTDSEIRAFSLDPSVVGASMPYSADYDVALKMDYERPLYGEVSLHSYASYRREGPRSFNLDFPNLRSEPHDFVDMRVGLRGPSWSLTSFAENLFDERQPEDVFGLFNGAVELARQPNRPRRYGIEVGYAF